MFDGPDNSVRAASLSPCSAIPESAVSPMMLTALVSKGESSAKFLTSISPQTQHNELHLLLVSTMQTCFLLLVTSALRNQTRAFDWKQLQQQALRFCCRKVSLPLLLFAIIPVRGKKQFQQVFLKGCSVSILNGWELY